MKGSRKRLDFLLAPREILFFSPSFFLYGESRLVCFRPRGPKSLSVCQLARTFPFSAPRAILSRARSSQGRAFISSQTRRERHLDTHPGTRYTEERDKNSCLSYTGLYVELYRHTEVQSTSTISFLHTAGPSSSWVNVEDVWKPLRCVESSGEWTGRKSA